MTKEEYAECLKDLRWRTKRHFILIRDKRKCVTCGSTDRLHVHHLKYTGTYPWQAPDEDLVTLCKKCHQKIHNIKPSTKNTKSVNGIHGKVSIPISKSDNNSSFFYFTDESLQQYLRIDSRKLYLTTLGKLIKKGILMWVKGRLNGKVQIFYIAGCNTKNTQKDIENSIINALTIKKK